MNAIFSSRLLRSLPLLALPLVGGGCSLSMSLDPKQGQNAAVSRGSATESSAATLVRLLDSDDPQVRSVAVRGLAEMGADARSATPALHRLIDDPDRIVRYESAKALAAVNPADPALPAMLVQIANDQRTPEEQRVEIRSLLQRVSPMMATTSTPAVNRDTTELSNTDRTADSTTDNTVVESIETTTVRSSPTTRPTGFEIITPDAPTTRPVMASERSEEVNETTSNGTVERSPFAPAHTPPPTTRPATRPVSKNEWSEIPGLAGLADASSQDTPPSPDINLFGYQSYTSASAVQVKDWIQRQAAITEQEKQARVKEFQDWRYTQDKLIYQKVLER